MIAAEHIFQPFVVVLDGKVMVTFKVKSLLDGLEIKTNP